MKGLILKDFYMIKKYLKFYLVMVVCFSVAYAFGSESEFFAVYPSVLSGVMITTLLSYDESFRFLEYADCLPITRKMFVQSKYALALIVIGTMGVLNSISTAMNLLFTDNFSFEMLIMNVCLLTLLIVFGFAITLPLTFKFGNEKGRILYILVIGLLSAVFMGIAYSNSFVEPKAWTVSLMLLAVAAFTFFVSMHLSIRFYEKREL